jgi:exopolyphosphatase / guanosine-5'-triphosphate,3'-diphosphate pyrophosphatase
VRVAAIDQGTNTTRLLVADVQDGRIDELARRTEITRLGEGVDERRRLLPLPIARVRNVLTDYRREAERLGAERSLVVATSAVRDAENGEAFLGEIEWSYGFATRLLSGDDEAVLTLRGIGAVPDDTAVFDIGGGSTEIVMTRGHVSVDVGSVRQTEQFGEDADAIGNHARALLEEHVPAELRPARAIGVAGTVTTLAALDLGLAEYDRERVHGHFVSRAAVQEQLVRLAALPLEERMRVPALDPQRAPVIVAGAAILRELISYFELDGVEASERGILHGAAMLAAELPEPVEGDAPPGAYTCC